MNFIKSLFRPKLSREAFEAYFNRLPQFIEVSWFRDGKYIVGNIKAGDQEFMTQGLNGDDFIEMVNDAVYTMFDIPEDYIDVIEKAKTFQPPVEERKKLEDQSVQSSVIRFHKSEQVLSVV